MRVGFGYDAHCLVEGRKLILAGVDVPSPKGLLGHSDGDVLTHAVIDAIIGALGEGDIGKFFPDTDQAYKDADSIKLLEKINQVLVKDKAEIANIDTTIVIQKPRLAGYIDEMRLNLAKALGIGVEAVNVKAKTEEGMGFTGNSDGVKAYAVCLLHRTYPGIKK
jgi:2-C-methyl-D-erythritol 2,4-cyclodiphosphate synthase